jgi:hypothetical protein
MSEHQKAYMLFISLPSACFFSWSVNSAAFNDERDAEIFREQFPDWKVN